MVDEAQTLSAELLEEMRLLANIETPSEKLLPLVLAGQPELARRLNDPALRQLKQRIALRCELRPFELTETAAYIASRIRTAGGDAARLFTREAVMLIHEHSRGIPRTISVICDNALVSGMALGKQPVGRDIVLEVCRDFDLDVASDVHVRAVTNLPDHDEDRDGAGGRGRTDSRGSVRQRRRADRMRMSGVAPSGRSAAGRSS